MITIPRAITEFREADDVNLTLTDKLVVNYDSGSDKFVTASVLSILGSQTANKVLASPDGSSGNSSFRALVIGDIPTITNAKLQNSSVTITAGTGMSGGGAVSLGSSITLTNAGVTSFNTRTGAVTLTLSDLTGLAVDTRYHVLAGVAGGQIGYGGTAASETLSLRSTSHATKGKVDLGQVLYVDEVNSRVGIGTNIPTTPFHVATSSGGGLIAKLVDSGTGNSYVQFGNSSAYVNVGGLNASSGYIYTTGHLLFYAGSGEYARISNTGKFGIGNSSPANTLNINTPTTSDTLAQLLVATGSTTNKGVVIQMVASQSANPFELQSSAGTIMTRITKDGDLRVIDSGDALSNIYMGGTGNNYGFQRSYNDMYYNAGVHHFKIYGGATAYLEIQSPVNDTIAAQCHLPTVQYSSVGFGAYGESGFIGAQFAGGVLSTGSGATRRRAFGLHGSLVVTSNATYTSRLTINASDYNNEKPGREGIRLETDGTNILIGFLGASAVVRQSIGAAATDAATTQTLVNNIRTALINLGLCST